MTATKSISAVLLAAVLLPGCKVGPDYKPPESKLPAQWTSDLAGGETNSPATDAAWWKSFNDPELDSLIARAVQSNLDLRVTEARVREARAMRGIVAANLGPTLNYDASYQRERLSQNGFPEFPPGIPLEGNIYQTGFDAAWEIDVFGGTRRAIESANASIAAADEGRHDFLVSLFGEVARDYVEARAAQRRLEILHENIAAQSQEETLAADRYRAGLGNQLDVEQAQSLLQTTQAQVPTREAEFRQSVYALGVLLGRPPGDLLSEVSSNSPIPSAPPVVPAGLPSDLLLRRPDIRRAERQLAAATAQIGVATADLFPKFSLTGDAGLQSIGVSDWFTAGSRFWQAGPTMQWRIFDTGEIRANIRLQNTRQEEALTTYESTVLVSMQEVETALTAYAKEQVRRQSLTDAADSTRQTVALAEQLYRNGLTDYLPVLDAERSLYNTQDSLAQSDRDVALNLVALYKALGGGWEVFGEQAAK